MGVTTTKTNKPLNPRGNDQSPLAYNRAKLYSGKALDFDGVNDVIEGSAPNLPTGANAFTTCFYFNKNADGEAVFWGTRSVNQSNGVGLFSGNKVVHFFYGNDLNSSSNIENGKWYFVAVTFDGTTRSIYINGQFDISDTPTGVNVTGTDYKLGYGGAYYHNGRLANTKVFDTALTAAQVADLYNNPEKVVPTGVDNTALKLWLPMMEGAGTTAYDGSGNGNHGTISGATYVNGVGAPVAQSAVMDWNKGVNLTNYSENGAQWSTANTITITQDQADPFGGTRAQRFTMDASSTYSQAYKEHSLITGSTQYTAKMWLKAVSGTPTIGINYNQGTWHQVTLTNEWAEYEVTRTMNSDYSFSHNIMIGTPSPGTSSTADFYIYGLQIQLGDTAGPYVPTFGTAQSTPVLLPQGLTTGRDITGVNLFENVRKQGALNLDGNSWAEVHDNASLDITPAMTMEAWINCDDISTTSYETIFAKPSGTTWVYPYAHYDLRVISANVQWWFEGTFYIATYNVSLSGWNHLLVTKDGASEILYINGVQVATHTGNVAISASPYDLILGANTDKDEKVSAQIAQPRIYNRALTAEEVLRNYNSGKNTYK